MRPRMQVEKNKKRRIFISFNIRKKEYGSKPILKIIADL
jgi:hypothetical protein